MSLQAHRLGESLVAEQLHPSGAAAAGTTSGEAASPDRSPGAWQRAFPLQQERHLIKARHNIYRAGEMLSGVPVVHSGWAARVRRLPDGRRQILSFILPGELVSAGAVFADRLSFYVEAITDVRYAVYQRMEPGELLARDHDLLQTLISGCLAEKADLEELAIDLGRRRAEERIARLFLQLRSRLHALGQASGMSFDMPLRQQHIADATGMTVIHVGRVIGALRNDGIVQLSGGVLAITDLAALKRLAEV